MRLAAIWGWLWRGKIVFGGGFILLAALGLSLIIWDSEAPVRLAGLLLQVLGMGFAVHGVLQIRKHYKHDPLRDVASNWWRERPWGKNPIGASVGMVAGPATISGTASVSTGRVSDNPDDPVDKRIDNLIKNLAFVDRGIADNSWAISEVRQKLDDFETEMIQLIETTSAKDQSNIESALTDGAIETLLGLVWIVVGVIMSTAPNEILCVWRAIFG